MNSVSGAHQEPTAVPVDGRFGDGHLPWREITPLLQQHHRNAVAVVMYDPRGGSKVKICTLARWQERRAKELLESNIAGRITLTELASACELSVRHFTRAFRGSTGTSPHAWLLCLRLERAKKLLANSDRDLVDVAFDCGFADQSHLTRVFQRFVGTSPGAWRRLHRL